MSIQPRTKRNRLNLTKQADAAHLLWSGTCAAHVMTKFKVSWRTTPNIKKRAEEIIKEADEYGGSINTKTFWSTLFSVIKKEMYDFVVIARAHKYPIIHGVIRERALLVWSILLSED